jgi:Helix-turn-helix domain
MDFDQFDFEDKPLGPVEYMGARAEISGPVTDALEHRGRRAILRALQETEFRPEGATASELWAFSGLPVRSMVHYHLSVLLRADLIHKGGLVAGPQGGAEQIGYRSSVSANAPIFIVLMATKLIDRRPLC